MTSCSCNSGNGARYGTEAYWTGWSYPDVDATRALVELGISGIGLDGPSADPVDTQDYRLHRIWLEGGRLILENLANLDQLPPRAPVVVAPLKVSGANGAPARVLALLPDEGRRAPPRRADRGRRDGAHPCGAVARARRRVRHLWARAATTGITVPLAYLIAGAGCLCLASGDRALREPDRPAPAGSTRTSRPASARARASSAAGSTAAASRSGISFVLVISSFFLSAAMTEHTALDWSWYTWFFPLLGLAALLPCSHPLSTRLQLR